MSKNKILVTEDNDDLCLLIVEILSKKLPEYEFITASSGVESLKRFENETLILALLDMNLPDMNGLDVAIKMREKNPNFPLIMVTAFSPAEAGDFAQKVNAFIRKPIDRNLLISTIKEILEKN